MLWQDTLVSIPEMKDEEAGKIFKAIIQYDKTGKYKLDDRFLNLLFLPIKEQIDKDKEKYEKILKRNSINGAKGGRPNKENPDKPKKPSGLFKNPDKPKETQKSPIPIPIPIPTPNPIPIQKKDITNVIQPPVEIPIKEKKEYGNKDINSMLASLYKAIDIDSFKESRKLERQYAMHMVNLGKKIGREKFLERLHGILEDDFKVKNCNSIKYLYGQMKSFIGNPKVEKKQMGVIVR